MAGSKLWDNSRPIVYDHESAQAHIGAGAVLGQMMKAHAHFQQRDPSLVTLDGISDRLGVADAAAEDQIRSLDSTDQAQPRLEVVPETRERRAQEELVKMLGRETKNRRLGWRQTG